MDESKVDVLLDKIDRDSLTVGATIPEEMEVRGDMIPLDDIVFEFCSDGELSDEFELSLDGFKRILRRERNDCIEQVEEGEISYQRGLELVEKISQIERALNVLEGSDDSRSLEEQMKLAEAKDIKRWKQFLDKINE